MLGQAPAGIQEFPENHWIPDEGIRDDVLWYVQMIKGLLIKYLTKRGLIKGNFFIMA
jgi:hypothetical protein